MVVGHGDNNNLKVARELATIFTWNHTEIGTNDTIAYAAGMSHKISAKFV